MKLNIKGIFSKINWFLVNIVEWVLEFLKELLKSDSNISSNRFLGVFVYTPVLIIMIFAQIPLDYCIAVIGLIGTLLVTNAVGKFANKKKPPMG